MSRRHLTEKQLAFLDFLRQHVQSHRVWPTYREVVDHFDFRSPNSVTQNLQALARKGYLERDRNGYRLADGTGDGRISVRATLGPAGREPVTPVTFLSLAGLFSDVERLQAVELDPEMGRSEHLEEATYVFVGEPPRDGLVLAQLDGRAGVWESIDGTVTIDGAPAHEAEVVGGYVGHAGPYGIVRHRPGVEA